MIAPWSFEYVGIPFKSGGRDHDGIDCYGLVRLVLIEQFGKELPLFNDVQYDAHDNKLVSRLLQLDRALISNTQVVVPEIGDVAVFRFFGNPVHAAVFVGSSTVLHVMHGTDSCIQQLESVLLKGNVEGFYHVN